jgi:hypothetical protein
LNLWRMELLKYMKACQGIPGSQGTTLSPPPELVAYFQLPSYQLNGTTSPIGVDMLVLKVQYKAEFCLTGALAAI